MRPDQFLHRRVYLGLVIFFLLAVTAFSPKYFSQLGRTMPSEIHFHGITMTLWLVMLIAQALLIRWKQYNLHRWVGRSSFILAPLVVFAILRLIHNQFEGAVQLRPFYLYFLSLVLVGALAYAMLYALAIIYRKDPMIHARFMVATIFPLVTPVTDRLFSRFIPYIATYMPRIEQVPILPTAGFLLADLMLLGLAIWDLKNGRKPFAFGIALAVVLFYHGSVFTIYRWEWWEQFCLWFVAL